MVLVVHFEYYKKLCVPGYWDEIDRFLLLKVGAVGGMGKMRKDFSFVFNQSEKKVAKMIIKYRAV